ncbi:hypothetical protein LSTR_LSTR002719 [Laodelphax striatellus]|uniref:MADF domain-containing protein n=1 Tax=Laodelphax striatellus TaxID=195883 RepID=A0A482X5Q7_LAOST|nr:hypothetical protein LSTR_LSTR002719 [Laodelphax striatellus]
MEFCVSGFQSCVSSARAPIAAYMTDCFQSTRAVDSELRCVTDMSPKFTNSDDEELIEFVSCNDILWKLSHPDYKNNVKRDLKWKKIGVSLNKSGEHCKSRWRTIRDNFKRHRKTECTGQPTKKKRATYWHRLRFLDDVEDERQGFSYTEDRDGPTGPEDVEDVSIVEEVDTETNEECNFPACSTQDECGKIVEKVKSNLIVEVMKRKEETQGQLMKTIEKLITPQVTVEEDIDIFLKSISSTIKQFTPAEKAEAKRKIFNLVSDIEIRHHAANNLHRL